MKRSDVFKEETATKNFRNVERLVVLKVETVMMGVWVFLTDNLNCDEKQSGVLKAGNLFLK